MTPKLFFPLSPSSVSVYTFALFSICALIRLQTQPCKENKCFLWRLQLCQQGSYLIQTEGSEKWWAGVGRIKTLCLDEALVQICSILCIIIHVFSCLISYQGRWEKVEQVAMSSKSQESIRSDWKCLLELHHCALFQHDLSPTEMQVHTWTLDLEIKNRACRWTISMWFFFGIHKNYSQCRMKYLIIQASEDNQ